MKRIVSLLLALSWLTGCATNTGNPSKDRAGRVTNAVLVGVFNTVLQAGISAGAAALQGQNGQDAAEAAFITAGTRNGIDTIANVLHEYAGPKIAPVADAAVEAIKQADPKTPAEQAAVLNTIGAAIQTAADQYAQ